MMQPPTFPARPLNGGALDVALPKRGDWRAEPKYNGWRALVHVPTGAMFNRKLERLSIEHEFASALSQLSTLNSQLSDWLDCEALSRRHGLGKGTLILLDLVTADAGCDYLARRGLLQASGIDELGIHDCPRQDSLYITPSFTDTAALWRDLSQLSTINSQPFFEGIVCKRATASYPMQRISASRETADWIKHRWQY